MKVIFPKNKGQRYYKIHWQFVLNIFRVAGCEVELQSLPAFDVCIDGTWVKFDYSDDGESINEADVPIFKFHYKPGHNLLQSIYPFVPISFYNWADVDLNLVYQAQGDTILNCQRPYGDAVERRNKLRSILTNYSVDYNITDQQAYWYKIKHCIVSVHVPGRNNNMLDRAQFQLMAFGCCTISPFLPEILTNKILVAGEHYIMCNDDYSDLVEIIEWCKINRDKCVEIGNNAKQLFRENFVPDKLVEYIHGKISH